MASSDKVEHERERQTGLLSEADRKWLLLSREEFVDQHSPQYWGQRRDTLIERVQHAFLDFTLLYDHLQTDLAYDIFDPEEGQSIPQRERGRMRVPPISANVLHDGIRDTLAFIMYGMIHENRTRGSIINQRGYEKTLFWDLFSQAIKQVGVRHGVLIDDIDPMTFRGREAPGIERIIERAKEGQELSGSEIQLLRRSGHLDEERFSEAIREAVTESATTDDE